MGMRNQKGFTIIEVLLFLGITGLLALALLSGWTTMINTQRYRDSVKTLQTFIQQQYGAVYNVQNGRGAMTGCVIGPDGPVFTTEDEGVSTPPGQTNCIILGRYIYISGGNDVTVYPIVGEDATESDNTSDRAAILARNPIEITTDIGLSQSELSVPWQAEVVNAAGNRMDMAIVIARSPESGAVHTYTRQITGGRPSAQDVIGAATLNDITLCLDPGVPLTGTRMGVVVRADASAPSFIQTTESAC